MRIRRNASKLLGSTTLYAIPPPPPTACAAAAAAAVDGEYREENNNNNECELNCSPWDLLLLNLDSNLDDYFLTDHSQEQENKGIFGNLIKTEQEEEEEGEPILPSSAITSSAAEFAVEVAMQTDEKKLIKQEKRRRKKKKKTYYKGKEEQDSTAETSTNNNSNSYCKKSDGKGWHCKQRAELPHSLCSYHIAQVRSYTSSFNHQASPASKSEAIDNYNSYPSDLYYYYEGFRPWRGKRRGSIPACNIPINNNNNNNNNNSTSDGNDEVTTDRGERDEDRSSCEIEVHGGDGGEDANIAGDDECDLDRFDDDDKDEGYRMKQDDDQLKKGPAVIKKRGRKPFKCRSLKSLL